MRTVSSIEKAEIKVSKDELINGKWVSLNLVSQKLADLEKSNNMGYKSLRYKFYNSTNGNKYNVETVCGVKCMDAENPMKATASLEITIIKE